MPAPLAITPIARGVRGFVSAVAAIAEREAAAARALADDQDAPAGRRRASFPFGLIELDKMRECAEARLFIKARALLWARLNLKEIRHPIIVIIAELAHACFGEGVELGRAEAATASLIRPCLVEALGFAIDVVSFALKEADWERGAALVRLALVRDAILKEPLFT